MLLRLDGLLRGALAHDVAILDFSIRHPRFGFSSVAQQLDDGLTFAILPIDFLADQRSEEGFV